EKAEHDGMKSYASMVHIENQKKLQEKRMEQSINKHISGDPDFIDNITSTTKKRKNNNIVVNFDYSYDPNKAKYDYNTDNIQSTPIVDEQYQPNGKSYEEYTIVKQLEEKQRKLKEDINENNNNDIIYTSWNKVDENVSELL
ncbi:MAG: hypothetical protein MUO21_01125, partial [Nitrososphaeraceae archaeon]|nr:hypothetical protein [Nitrososphaeraceae archaeon]